MWNPNAFLFPKSSVLAISASVNQRLLENEFHFVIEKLFSEPKIGSNSGSSTNALQVVQHFILFVIQLLAVFHIYYNNHKHQSARKWFYTMF
jgi:hypothetical protein